MASFPTDKEANGGVGSGMGAGQNGGVGSGMGRGQTPDSRFRDLMRGLSLATEEASLPSLLFLGEPRPQPPVLSGGAIFAADSMMYSSLDEIVD